MKKVSVIIPMYNAEPYICQCVRSVMSQTWRNLEILVIDDGSTDRSLELCKKLCRHDARMRVFGQENQGVSVARNRGLEEAAGDYMFFLDSDDAIHPWLIETLVHQTELSQAEMVFCSFARLDDRKIKERLHRNFVKVKTIHWKMAENQESEEWFHIKYERELFCVWGKLIRRDMIGRKRFYEKIISGEDTLFMYELCRRQVKMVYGDIKWYYYRSNSDSLTHSYDMDRIWQKLRVYERIRDQEYRIGHQDWALKWERGLVWNILSAYLVMRNRKNQENSRNLKRRMLLEMKNPVYRQLSVRMKVLFFGLLAGCSFPPVRTLWVMKQKLGRTY